MFMSMFYLVIKHVVFFFSVKMSLIIVKTGIRYPVCSKFTHRLRYIGKKKIAVNVIKFVVDYVH
jgi:hypothetical protein